MPESGKAGYLIFTISGSTGSVFKRIINLDGHTNCCRFANNNMYAIGTLNNKLYIYYANGTLFKRIDESSMIIRIAWRPDSLTLAYSNLEGSVKIFSLTTNTTVQTYSGSTLIYGLDWSSDNSFIAVANTNNDIIILNRSSIISPLSTFN